MPIPDKAELENWVRERAFQALAIALYDATFAEAFIDDFDAETVWSLDDDAEKWGEVAQRAYEMYADIAQVIRRGKTDKDAFCKPWEKEYSLDRDSLVGRRIMGFTEE